MSSGYVPATFKFWFNYAISGGGSIFHVIIVSFMENYSDIKTEKSFTAVTADSPQTNMGKKRKVYVLSG